MCCQKCTLDLQERRSINGQRFQGLAIRTWQLTGSNVPKNDSHRAIHHCCKRCTLDIGLQLCSTASVQQRQEWCHLSERAVAHPRVLKLCFLHIFQCGQPARQAAH